MLRPMYKYVGGLLIVILSLFIIQITRSSYEPLNIEDSVSYTISHSDDYNHIQSPDILWQDLSDMDQQTINLDDHIWFRIHLPVLGKKDGLFVPNIIAQSFDLYADKGNLINPSPKRASGYHNLYLLQPLSPAYSSDTFYLHVVANQLTLFNHFDFYIGALNELKKLDDNLSAAYPIVGVIIILVSITIVLMSLNADKHIRHMAYGTMISLLCYGYFIAYGDGVLMHALYPMQSLMFLVYILLICNASILSLIYFKLVVLPLIRETHYNRVFYGVLVTSLVLSAFFIITYFMDLDVTKYYPLGYFMLFGLFTSSYFTVLYYAFKHVKSGNESARIIILGYCLYTLAFFIELVADGITGQPFATFGINKWGLVILCFGSIYIFFYHYKSHTEQMNQLKKEQASLTINPNNHLKTRLPNQLQSIDKVARSITRYTLDRMAFTTAICEIDDLSELGHTYGPHFVDYVLIEIAKTIKDYMGPNHFIGAWRDNSFLLVIYEPDEEEAYLFLEALRNAIKFTTLRYHQQMVHVTATIGCCSYYSDDRLDDYIERIKQALFFGKHHGYDTTISYQHIIQMDPSNQLS